MNLIYTIGGNKKQRELVSDVAYFCIDKLMPRMKTLDVEIQINNLKNNFKIILQIKFKFKKI